MLAPVGLSLVVLIGFAAWGVHLVVQVDDERGAVEDRVGALIASRGVREALDKGTTPDFDSIDIAGSSDVERLATMRSRYEAGDIDGAQAALTQHVSALRRDNAQLSSTLGSRFDTLIFLVGLAIVLGMIVTAMFALGAFRERRLELALQQSAKDRLRAERAEQLKDRLLANTAHELRTPLASVLGLVELSRDDPGQIDEALVHGYRLASLLQDLLDLARMQSGRTAFVTEAVDVKALIEVNAVVPLSTDVTPIRAQVSVRGFLELDPRRLTQIVNNLCSNALRYAPGHPVDLSASWEQDVLTLVVEDRGPGLGEHPETLFDPYVQGAQAHGAGLGLGLTVVRETVSQWGGTIRAERRVGGGARIVVGLPCREVERPPARAMITAPPWAIASILLVEDDPTLRLIVTRLLQKSGYQVRAVESGELALENLEPAPLAVLLDWHLPGIDGLETARKIRAAGIRSPLIALTARAAAEDVHQVLRSGFDAHLAKPVQPELLLDTLASLLPETP